MSLVMMVDTMMFVAWTKVLMMTMTLIITRRIATATT